MGSGPKTGASQVELGNRRAKTDKSRRAGVCVLTAIAVVLLISPAVTIPILFTPNAKLSSRQVIILRSALLYPSFQFSYQTNCTYAYQSYSQGAAYVTTAASTFATTVNASVTPLVGGFSITSKGNVQAGGGTSIFRNVGPLPLETCPEYLSGSAVFDDKFLISFLDKRLAPVQSQ
jgi:hypothetical protein